MDIAAAQTVGDVDRQRVGAVDLVCLAVPLVGLGDGVGLADTLAHCSTPAGGCTS